MIARAQDLLDRLTQLRQAVLAEANGLSAEDLVHRPDAGVWSVLDVIEHLVRVEEAILSRVRQRDPRTWRGGSPSAGPPRNALDLVRL